MFADPQSITVSGSAKSLNRTPAGDGQGRFATADGAYSIRIQHTYGKRNRRTIGIRFDSLVANPLVSGSQIPQSFTTYLVTDGPAGYDTATAKAVVDALVAYLAASSGAAVTKLLGGEA